MRLRTYLILLVVAALLPVIMFSTIALTKLQESHRSAALESIRETARATALNIDRELNGVQSALKVLATSESLAAGDYETFHQKAKIASIEQGWIILYNAESQQVINTRVAYGSELPRRSSDLDELKSIQSRNVFHVSGLRWGTNANRHVIMIEMPVAIGSQQYVLSQALPSDYFDRAFKGNGIPKSWVVGIFDKDGITLARSHKAEEFVGKSAKSDTVEAIQSAYSGVLRHNIREGLEVYDVFTRSSLTDWAIAIGAPVAEVDRDVNQAVWIAAMGLLIAILVATGMAWFISRRIMRSMKKAVVSASALGRGLPVAELPDSGISEFNMLHTTLSEASQELDRQKEQRLEAEAQRNVSLVNEQKARKHAEDQNRAKDQFLAMLGHELRNPLAAITSAIDLLDMGDNIELSHRAKDIIRRQGEHLNHIVNDLLDVNRVLSGKVLLDKQPLDLTETARACLLTLQSTGRTHGYTVTLSGNLPVWVHADATRMEQVINNLLDNAIKYTPQGGKVHVFVRAVEQDALLEVLDDGIGISSELLPHIFDVFVQGDRSLDRAQGGLGIGLSLVKQLAELHGGTIACESNGEGRGTKFTLRLPHLANYQNDPDKEAGWHATTTCTVLLIDDHDDAREMTDGMLTRHGFNVITANDGMAGIKLAKESKPDIALIDIGMPRMNGYEIARYIRSLEELKEIKLVALTGYGSEEDRHRAIESGFDMHLIKPLSVLAFTKALEQLCIEKKSS